VFIGYPFSKKGWTVCDLEIFETFVSRDVIFCENQFPFATQEKKDLAVPGSP